MFNEKMLFDGEVDHQNILRIGPLWQTNYKGGRYTFSILPDRVDVKENAAQEILAPELMNSAETVSKMIEPFMQTGQVTGVGMNCDTVFGINLLGETGTSYCAKLAHSRFDVLIGEKNSSGQRLVRARFSKGPVINDIRIEPLAQSVGRDLWVALNAHQNVTAGTLFGDVFSHAEDVRRYVTGLHTRIIGLRRGG